MTVEAPLALSDEPPLCVDLDGTLIRTDSLAESMVGLVAKHPRTLLKLPLWLMRGRAVFKANIAGHNVPDPRLLPYNEAILNDLQEQRRRGRTLVLVTAANAAVARAVADHLKIFDHVFASDANTNLKSSAKAQHLVEQFGRGGFDYIGDSIADLPVWSVARRVLLVRHGTSLEQRLQRKGLSVHTVYESRQDVLRALPKLLRIHQWLKNLLLFVPLVTALSVFHVDQLLLAGLAFVIFGMCASSVYVINDLLDLPSDRRHARKRLRPFASGSVSPWFGFGIAPALLTGAFTASLLLMPPMFTFMLAAYTVTTFAYSIFLKQIVLIDVVMLATLYTMRIIAGAFAIGVLPSFWLLAFSMFIFLSLALIKRFTELQEAHAAGVIWIAGRGYKSTDLRLLMSLGTAAGNVAVLVLALYIDSDKVRTLYERPALLWALCPLLLYWVARMWMQAERANMHDDPVVFAVKDRVTHYLGATAALVIFAAAWPA